MTVVAIFAQTPSPVSFSVLKANLIFPTNTLWPSIASTAGNTITEKSIATETASVPPIPRLGKPVPVKNSIPINPIATVTPLKKIGIFDCSDAFYESGLDKVQRAVDQYKLFYETPDFDPQQFFINKTL